MNIALFAAAVLLCLTLLTTHLVGGLYARYTTQAAGSDSARVAAFVFDTAGGDLQQTLQLQALYPGCDPIVYAFEVTNTKDSRICEVAQEYTVYITNLGSLPLTYAIDSDDVTADNGGFTGALAAGRTETDQLTLTVSWPSENASLDYAGGVASLHIRIVAEQID